MQSSGFYTYALPMFLVNHSSEEGGAGPEGCPHGAFCHRAPLQSLCFKNSCLHTGLLCAKLFLLYLLRFCMSGDNNKE